MDWTTLQHSLIALACLGIGWLLGNPAAGAVVGITIFVVRELTQAEYRWIDKFGKGLRSNMPWYGMLDPRVWDISNLTDWLVPLLVNIITLMIISYFR